MQDALSAYLKLSLRPCSSSSSLMASRLVRSYQPFILIPMLSVMDLYDNSTELLQFMLCQVNCHGEVSTKNTMSLPEEQLGRRVLYLAILEPSQIHPHRPSPPHCLPMGSRPRGRFQNDRARV